MGNNTLRRIRGIVGVKKSSNISDGEDEPDLLDPVSKIEKNQHLINRLLGCAYGQALGDAYGLSTEF
ncbi:unnamed protein product, partial [Rotaria sp. Silwood1]